jgi:hypothetical protein
LEIKISCFNKKVQHALMRHPIDAFMRHPGFLFLGREGGGEGFKKNIPWSHGVTMKFTTYSPRSSQ